MSHETLFKVTKSSGFNIEDTHVAALDRLEKLISLTIIFCVAPQDWKLYRYPNQAHQNKETRKKGCERIQIGGRQSVGIACCQDSTNSISI
ncbi:hypothetical protein ABIB40_001163 [Pedobacter sp. UYP30]